MNKGQEIRFTDISSPMEIKMLNDTLNYIMTVLRQRFDLNEKYKTVFASSSLTIPAGTAKEVVFGQTFAEEPQIVASSESGANVRINIASGESDMKKKVKLSFTDPTASGIVNVIAMGKAEI